MSSSTYGWSSSQHPRAQEPEDNSSIEQHPEQDQYQPQHPLLSGYQQPYPLYHMPSTYSTYTHPPPPSVPVWSHHHPSMTGVIVHPPPQYPLARRSPDRDEDSIRSHHYGSASGTPLPTPVSATSFRSMTSSTSTSASASTRHSELRPNDGSRPIMLSRSRRAAAAKANSNISSVTAILRAPSLPIVQSDDEESQPKTGASSSRLVLREKDEVSSDEESLPEANETDDEEYGVTARPKRDLGGAATRPKRAGYTARAVRARNPVNRQAPVKAKPGRSRARGKASRAKKEQQVDDTLPFALQNCRGPLLDVPPGAEVEVNGLLILTPPAVQAPPSAFQPFNQYSQAPAPEGYQSPFEMYTCRACAKTYDGKNARSVARRHLQDKHGVPLALQARRTRWDGAPAEVPHVVAAEAREKNLLSKRLWANKNRSIQRIEREYATFLAPYGPNGVVTPCGVRLVAPEMRKVQPEDGEYSDGERLSWNVLPPNMKTYMDMVRQGQTLPLLLLRRPLGENKTKMVPLVPGPIKTGAKAKTSKKRGGQKQPTVDPELGDADSGAEEDLDYSFTEDQAAGPSTSQSNSLYPLQSTWPQGDPHNAPAAHLSEQELQAGLAHHAASVPYTYGSVQYGQTYTQLAFTAPHHFHPRQDAYNQEQLGGDDAYDVEGEEELDDQSEHSPVLQQLQPTAVVHQQWVQTVMPPIYTNGVWYQPYSGTQSYSYPQGPMTTQQNQVEVAHIEEMPNLDVKGMDDSLAETHLQEEDVHGVVENEKSDSDIEVENIAAESLLDLHSTPMQPETDSPRPAVNTSILSSSSLATLQRTGSGPSSNPSTVGKSSHLTTEIESSRSGLMDAPEIMSRPRPVRSRSVVQPFVKSRPDAYSCSISFNEHVELDDPFMTGSPMPSNKKRRNTFASPSPLQQKKKRDTISDRMPLSVLQANSALGGSLLGNISNVSPMKLDKSSLDRPGMDYTTPMRPSHGVSASASRPSLWMLSSPTNGDAAASLGLAPGWGGLLSTPGVSGIVASDTPGRGGGSMSKLWDRRGSVIGMGKKET